MPNLDLCVNKYVKQFQAIDFLLQLLDTGFIKCLELVHNRFLTCTDALKKPAMPSAPLHPIISCSLYTKSFDNRQSLGTTQKSIYSLRWTKRSMLIYELHSCLLNDDCMTSCYKTWVWRTDNQLADHQWDVHADWSVQRSVKCLTGFTGILWPPQDPSGTIEDH